MTADFKCIEMHGGKIQVWVKMCGNDRVSLTPICFGLTLSSALKQKQPPQNIGLGCINITRSAF